MARFVVDPEKLDVNIRQWYMEEYPSDSLGSEIRRDMWFFDYFYYFASGCDAYDLLGVGDSVVRGRVFEKLSELLECDYNDVYDLWV